MALQTPTTAEINAQIIAQLEATLNQTVPLLPKAFLRVLSKALAATFILLYKYGGFIFLQMFVKTATPKDVTVFGQTFSPLKEWGRLVGAGDPVEAVQAQLEIEIVVETQGGSLEAGTPFIALGNGVSYLLVGAVLLNASTVTGTIRASGDQGGGDGSGAIGNLQTGESVQFANPPANVVRTATVISQIIAGANEESADLYRQRIIDRFQKRPQGGALIDYELWGEEVAGIVNVYPYTGDVPGQVDVYVEATPASSGSADGIPTAGQLQQVLDAIELDDNGLASRRPANAFPNVYPITRNGFDVTVTGLNVSNPAVVQADITTALETFFADREPFVSGVTLPPRRDQITRSALIGLVEDIVTAANGTFTTVSFVETGFSVGLQAYTLAQGEKAKMTNPPVFA